MLYLRDYPCSDCASREEAPILLILHGLFGSADNWNSQARDLSDRFHVMVPDMPDHGSSPHSDEVSYDSMVAAVRELILDAGRPVNILGHSMGGKVAMATALLHPEVVSSVVVADIAPVRYPPRHEEIFRAMEEVSAAILRGEVENRAAADRVMEPLVRERQIRAFILKNLVPAESGYRWRLNLAGLQEGYRAISGWPLSPDREGLSPYMGPALFIRAENSPYITDEDVKKITPLFPNAAVELMKGVGHWLHAEDRQRFLSLVRSFLM